MAFRSERLLDEAKFLLEFPSAEYNEVQMKLLEDIYKELRGAYQEADQEEACTRIRKGMQEVAVKMLQFGQLKQDAQSNTENQTPVPNSNSTSAQTTAPSSNSHVSNSDCLSFKQITFDGNPLEFKHHLLQVEGLLKKSNWDDVMKFQYLRNSLPVDTRKLIAHIDPENPVIADAFASLRKHYLSDDKIKEDIIKRVMKLPKVYEDSAMNLWNDYVEVIEHVRLNQNAYDSSTLAKVVGHLAAKLSAREYNELLLLPGTLTVETLKTFIEPRRERARKITDQRTEFEVQRQFYNDSSTNRQFANRSQTESDFTRNRSAPPSPSQSSTQCGQVLAANDRKWACLFCKGDHQNVKCPLGPEQREEAILKANKCKRCFYTHENGAECNEQCRNCRGPHHSWLCKPKNSSGSQTKESKLPPSTLTTGVVAVRPTKVDNFTQTESFENDPVPYEEPTSNVLQLSAASLSAPSRRIGYLPIASVRVGEKDREQERNGLYDCGSTSSFASRSLTKAVNAETRPISRIKRYKKWHARMASIWSHQHRIRTRLSRSIYSLAWTFSPTESCHRPSKLCALCPE